MCNKCFLLLFLSFFFFLALVLGIRVLWNKCLKSNSFNYSVLLGRECTTDYIVLNFDGANCKKL